jgi:serine/threonine protein phosphatase PrpC
MKIIGRTGIGKLRSNNEDALAFDAKRGIAVLADGMGGINAGEIASRQSAQAILEHLQTLDYIDDVGVVAAVQTANRHVFALSWRDVEVRGMGTTVVVWARLDGARFALGHVGDSRAYRINRSGVERLTRDHSVVQNMVDQGFLAAEEARAAPNRNVITRAWVSKPRCDATWWNWTAIRTIASCCVPTG